MPWLALSLLGSPRLELDGNEIPISRRKVMALLAYLAVTGRSHRRVALATLLWPEYDSSSARADLRRTLSVLNRTLGGDGISADRETAGLNPDLGLWLDVDAFQHKLAVCDKHNHPATEVCAECVPLLEQAVKLYRDDFMTGFSLEDSAAFDEWQFFQTEGLRDKLGNALERLVRWYTDQGKETYEQAIVYARRWLVLDPLNEAAHRQLMVLYAQNGQHSAALRQYQQCVDTLAKSVGAAPGEETIRLYEMISRGVIHPLTETTPAPPSQEMKDIPALSAPQSQAPKGERRLATVLIAGIQGFTELAEEIDLETWAALRREVLGRLRDEVIRYGGDVNSYQGDGLVAFFGVPTAHENDAERAVLSGLAMQDTVEQYAADLVMQVDITLSLRVGVNTGEVIATYAGDRIPGREETAMGQAVSLGARLETAAEPGTVLVGEDSYRLIAPLFEWESCDPVLLRGMSQPLIVYRPLVHQGSASKGRGIEGLTSPIVGRDAELNKLQEALELLEAGIGGIVTLVGEAGIGKSRLVTELRKLANVGGREGRCLSYATDVAYQLWLDMLRNILGVSPGDSPETVRDALRNWVQRVCPGRFDDIYPYLGRLLSLPLEEKWEQGLRGLEAGALQVLTFRAIETVIISVAKQQPLLLVCEDLHWADPTSLVLLKRLLPLTDQESLLFLCVFRPELQHGCWQIREIAARDYTHRHIDLWLRSLSSSESGRLVANLLTVEDLPHVLRERVLEQAEGNPLFVEEIIRSLIDGDIIAYDTDAGQWRAVQDVTSIEMAIPDSLRGVLTARIDRLPLGARRVLQQASVIGRIFSRRLLAEIAEDEELDIHILVLLRAQMIRERSRMPEVDYIFKHELTREAAYGSFLRQERRIAHRQVAEVIERLYPEHIEEQLGLLAHHWELTGDDEQAVEYLRRAGEQAMAQYANLEAIDYFSRALVLLPKEVVTIQNIQKMTMRYELLLARETLYNHQPMRQEEQKDLGALAKLAEELDESCPKVGESRQAEVALRWVDYAVDTGTPGTIEVARKAIAQAQKSQDRFREAMGYCLLGWLLSGPRSEFGNGQKMLERALALARDIEAHWLEALCLFYLGLLNKGQLHLTAARTYYEKALYIFREIGDRFWEARVLYRLGKILFKQGDHTSARAHYEQSLNISRQIGARILETITLGVFQGEFFFAQENYAKAREYMEQALRIAREMQDPSGEGWYLHVLGYMLLTLGFPLVAKEYFEQGLAIFQRVGNQMGELHSFISIGMPPFYMGNYSETIMWCEKCLIISHQLDHRRVVVFTIMGLLLHCQGEDEKACEYAQQALQINSFAIVWFFTFPMIPALVLGHALAGLDELVQAVDAYTQALDVCRVTGWSSLPMEPLAGLARVALAQGHMSQAQTHVETILEHLKTRTLNGTLQPFRIYLTCYRVLEAASDPRAVDILQTAYQLLQERASFIDDETLRISFLENVSAHREIVELYQQREAS